jgi:hypothetical protein
MSAQVSRTDGSAFLTPVGSIRNTKPFDGLQSPFSPPPWRYARSGISYRMHGQHPTGYTKINSAGPQGCCKF